MGLGVAATSMGIVLATLEPTAIVFAAASGIFSGWLGSEMLVTRVEMLRDEREGRLVIQWMGVGSRRELVVPIDDLLEVVLERSRARSVRVTIVLAKGERIALTPYQMEESGAEEVRKSVSALLAIGGTLSGNGLPS